MSKIATQEIKPDSRYPDMTLSRKPAWKKDKPMHTIPV
jgi:hypothetical protein